MSSQSLFDRLTFDDPCQRISRSYSLQASSSFQPLQEDLAVPANTCVFAHVNARGRSHASRIMLSWENASLSSSGGSPTTHGRRFCRESIHRKTERYTQQAHFLLPVAHHAHAREIDGFLDFARSSEEGVARHVPRKLGDMSSQK